MEGTTSDLVSIQKHVKEPKVKLVCPLENISLVKDKMKDKYRCLIEQC